MCPHHRRLVLAMVKRRLAEGLPTLLVATQLVEAGVDVSFPEVWRALAPADSLQQAGGRANRNGELAAGGLVVVFDPLEGRRPPEYERACGLTVKHFGPDGAKLDDQAVLARYYRELYDDLQLDHRPLDWSKANAGPWVQRNRENLDFVAVVDGPRNDTGVRDRKKAFRMILDESMPVVVTDPEHNDTIEALLGELAAGATSAALALRRLQPWIVQLRSTTALSPGVTALIDPVVGDLGRWQGIYDWDPDTCRGMGLDEEDMDVVI
jgi:CRISPR-associated endonuclease/helicase Cas3